MPQLLFQFQRNGNSADGPILETLIHILSQRKLQYDGIQKQDDGVTVDFSDPEEAKNAFKTLDGMEIMGSYLAIKPSPSGVVEMNGNATHKEKHSKSNRYSRGGYKEDYTCDQDGYPEQPGGRQYHRRYNQRQNYGGNYHYQQQQPPPPQPPKIEQYPCRILIPSDMVKVVLGKGGITITSIQNKTDTKIDVHRDKNNRNRPSEDTLTSIRGDPENFSDAIKEILEVMNTEYDNRNIEESRGLQLKILAHDLLCGRIIGKGGNNLKKVRQDSGVTKLIISNSIYDEGHQFGPNGMVCSGERVITIEGTVEAVSTAERILSQRLRDYMEKDMKNSNNLNGMGQQNGYYNGNMMNGYQGGYSQHQMIFPRSPHSHYGNPMGSYMNYYPYYPGYMNNHPGLLGQGYPPFPGMMASPPQGVYGEEETCCISIPTKEVGAIIGRNGGYINKVKQYSNAQVRVVKGDDGGESRVEIKGTPDAQWRASLCVFGKIKETMKVPYSEAQLKTEYLVPGTCVGRIIGKKGLVVQDIQDKAQTDIEVPKDKQGGDDVPVYITGTFHGTQVALNRIRDIVQRARSKPPSEERNS